MRRYLGRIVVRARKERSLSQIKLVEQIGDHLISLKTLRRIENGHQSVSDELIKLLLDFFGIDLSYDLRDSYEEALAEQVVEGYLDSLDEDDQMEPNTIGPPIDPDYCNGIVSMIANVNREIMLYRVLFSRKPDMPYDFHIYNIVNFAFYLPLIDMNNLNEFFLRMDGDFRGRLDYFLKQLEDLYNKIPNSTLKSDVDDIVREMIDPEYKASMETHKRYRAFLEKKHEVDYNFGYYCEEYVEYRKKIQNDRT